MNSSMLVRLCIQEPEAWRRLVRLFYPLVRSWVQRLGVPGEDAADVAQEVFAVLARKITRFERDGGRNSFRGWLWGVTRNEALTHHRRQKRQVVAVGGSDAQRRFSELPDPDCEDNLLPEDTPTMRNELALRAVTLLRTEFEERTWRAFWRTAVENQSTVDVAAELGLSVNSVYLARSRVLRRLRAEFGDLLDTTCS